MDAVTGPVMETVCSGANLHPCSVLLSSSTLNKKLTNGVAEAPLPDFSAKEILVELPRLALFGAAKGFYLIAGALVPCAMPPAGLPRRLQRSHG
jgi:hypothetical protein